MRCFLHHTSRRTAKTWLSIIASSIIDDAKVAKRVHDKNQRDVDVDVTSIFLGVFSFGSQIKGDGDPHERGIPFQIQLNMPSV